MEFAPRALTRAVRLVCYIFASALCVACVYSMQMPEPSASSRALLRYVTTGAPGYTQLWRVSPEGCPTGPPKREFLANTGPSALLFVDEKEQSKLTMLGSSGKAESYVRERYIPADSRFVYELHAGQVAVQYVPGFECTNTGSFVPEPNAQYELYYDVTAGGKKCAVSVYKLEPDGQSPFVRKEVRTSRIFYPPRQDVDYCKYTK